MAELKAGEAAYGIDSATGITDAGAVDPKVLSIAADELNELKDVAVFHKGMLSKHDAAVSDAARLFFDAIDANENGLLDQQEILNATQDAAIIELIRAQPSPS